MGVFYFYFGVRFGVCAVELGKPLLFVSIVRLLCSGVGWHCVCVRFGVLCGILCVVFMFVIAEVFPPLFYFSSRFVPFWLGFKTCILSCLVWCAFSLVLFSV